MTTTLINKLKPDVNFSNTNPKYSILMYNNKKFTKSFWESANPSDFKILNTNENPIEYLEKSANPLQADFEYSYEFTKAKSKKSKKDLFRSAIATIVFAAMLGTGCLPYYEPITPEKPTPTEQTAEPSPSPIITTEPTSTPIPTPTPLPNYIDISGKVEDNKTHTGQEALIQVYDTRTQNIIGDTFKYNYSDTLGEFKTDSSGNFSFTLDKLVSDNPEDKIYIRTRTGDSWDNENADSYIRTIELLATQDHNPITAPTGNPAIRVTLYPNFCTPEEFKEFMKETNLHFDELTRFDLSNLKKIKIFKNSRNPNEGSFTDAQLDYMKDITIANDGVETALPNGMQLDDYVEIVKGRPPYLESNHIYIYPDNDLDGAAGRFAPNYSNHGIVGGARIRIDPNTPYMQEVLLHELMHAFTAQRGHSTLHPNLSATYCVSHLENPGVADIESSEVIYEETHQYKEKIDNILGMNSSKTDFKYTYQVRDKSYNISEMNKEALVNCAN